MLGIRPEDLDDAALANGDPRPRLTGRVELREALGSEVLVHFTIAARQAVTDDVRELAEDVGDDRAVGQLAAGLQPDEASSSGGSARGRACARATRSRSSSTSAPCTSSTPRRASRSATAEPGRR